MDLGGEYPRILENVQELRDLYSQAVRTTCQAAAVAITSNTLTRHHATAAHGALTCLASLRFKVLDRRVWSAETKPCLYPDARGRESYLFPLAFTMGYGAVFHQCLWNRGDRSPLNKKGVGYWAVKNWTDSQGIHIKKKNIQGVINWTQRFLKIICSIAMRNIFYYIGNY